MNCDICKDTGKVRTTDASHELVDCDECPLPDSRTDAKKIEMIGFIVDRQAMEQDNEEGDKYLSNPEYALEAIAVVLHGADSSNGALRMYLEAR